jgi:hypothetical protein
MRSLTAVKTTWEVLNLTPIQHRSGPKPLPETPVLLDNEAYFAPDFALAFNSR